MTTPEEEQDISSGWSTADIAKTLKNGENCLEPLDPFISSRAICLFNVTVSDMMTVICSKSTKVLFNICRPKMKRTPVTQSGSLKMDVFLML